MRLCRSSVAFATLVMLSLAACEGGSSVGKDIDLEKIKGGQKGPRLGEAASPSPTPTAGQPAQKPTTPPPIQPTKSSPTPTQPSAQVFEVTLTRDSPYYHPGQVIQVPVGTTIRFTNRDEINRQPFAQGYFEAPSLAPGRSFEYLANVRTNGQVQINDRIATFKVGFLEVY